MSTTEAFHLVGVVEARTRGAEADLHRFDRTAQNSARNFNASMGSTERGFLSAGRAASGFLERFAHISNIIQGIPQIGQLAGALTRPLFNAAQEGVKLNMTLEQAAIGYAQVAGSEQKALGFLKELQAFGQRSPFRFEGLLQASRLMTTFGFELNEQIPKLTIWGNAIASSGELSADKIHDVVTAFGQMRMAGRVNAQDMMQLTNANIPGWELLAKAIGKTVAETRKLSEAGRLDGTKAVEAITAMMAIDPRYKNMMQRLEKTTAGRLSAAEDVIQFAQAKATKSLTGDISKTLEASLSQADLADRLAGKIDSTLKPISGAITGAVTAMLTGDADGLKNVAKDVLGSALSSGLADGISAGASTVKDAIGSLVTDGVVNPFKNLLGIHSPSTVFIEFGHNAAEGFNIGFAEGLLDDGFFQTTVERFLGRVEGQLSARQKRAAENLAKLMEREPGFKPKLITESAKRGINPDHLLNVMAVETAGSFNPAAKNPNSSASGLIQFMADTAKQLGTTTAELRRMSATKQLDFVFKYFDDFIDRGYNLGTQGALYAAVGAGKVGKSDNSVLMRAGDRGYAGNAPTWDRNMDGIIRQGEMAMAAVSKLGAGVNFTINGAPVTNTNPVPVSIVTMVAGSAGGQVIGGQKMQRQAALPAEVLNDARLSAAVGHLVGTRYNQPLSTTDTMATSLMPKTAQALEQMASNTERIVKGAGEWADVITQSEEATKRLKVQWDGIAQTFESAFLSATGQAIQGHFLEALKGFALDFSFDVAQQVNAAFAARLSKVLFDFQGSDSAAGGGLVSKALNKIGLGGILEKLGLQTPRHMTAAQAIEDIRNQPLSTSNVMATSLSGGAGGATEKVVRGSMPASKGKTKEAPADTEKLEQAVDNSTQQIVSSQQTQTAQLSQQMASNTDRIVDAVTPRTQGFWKGLLGTVLSAAAGAAAGTAVSMALGGGPVSGGSSAGPVDEGPKTPRPTTPPVLKPAPKRASGGMVYGPGSGTSDSILGVDRQGVPTALVSNGEFVVNAMATRKNRAALEIINRTGKMPRLGLGGFLKWTSPISHEGVRSATMPITHEGFRNATMPISNPSVASVVSPGYGYLSGAGAGRQQPTQSPAQQGGRNTHIHNHHYHFHQDAAGIKKSRRQIERQMAQSLRATTAQLN